MNVDAEVTFTLHGETNARKGKCRNLSHSGIQFETEKPLSEGKCMELIVDTKSKKFRHMIVKVEVLRVEPLEHKESIISRNYS